jgi:hypothetical protein
MAKYHEIVTQLLGRRQGGTSRGREATRPARGGAAGAPSGSNAVPVGSASNSGRGQAPVTNVAVQPGILRALASFSAAAGLPPLPELAALGGSSQPGPSGSGLLPGGPLVSTPVRNGASKRPLENSDGAMDTGAGERETQRRRTSSGNNRSLPDGNASYP